MKRTLPALAVVAVLLISNVRAVVASGLISGRYVFNTPYAAVCLNGTYPFAAGEIDTRSFITVNTDANGALTGTLDLRSLKAATTGSLTAQGNGLHLQLHTSGQDASQVPSDIGGTLQGSQFIGTGTTGHGTVLCTLDVSAAAPLTVTYELDLTVDGQGKVSGNGTATTCAGAIAVTVTGTSNSGSCSLHITAPSIAGFVWDGNGGATYTGFTADWNAHGFGLSPSGKGVVVEPKASAPALLGNISTRLPVQTDDNVLIGGFIITGTQPKKVIIRAIGSSLTLPGKLLDPQLELHDSTGGVIAANDNWQDAANKQAIIDSTVAPANAKESAVLVSLTPGSYTAIVRGVNKTTGIAVVEIYDLDRTVDSRLANISTRGFVQSGDNVLIGGFIVLGNAAQRVVIRAIGPSLPLSNKLVDPLLELHDPNGGLLAVNDNWVDSDPFAVTVTQVAPTNVKESAIVATLIPGPYTAIVRGVNGATGIAVVEAYGLNP